MKEQEAKQLEDVVARAMQKTTLETPSLQFTDRVMAAVNAQPQSATVSYIPLIPKYIWVAIIGSIVGTTVYLWFSLQPTPLTWPSISFHFMENNPLSKELADFTVSKITGYAVLLLALMVCVQIPILKRYFDKRWMV